LPPALTAHIVRYTVKKFSGGREDLLPDDIDDPELLLRSLVRKYQFELTAAKSTEFRAQREAGKLQKQVSSLQEAGDEAQTLAREASSKLAYSERKLADYRSRIAMLGNRWESMTGFTNDELERDPSAAAKRFKGELRATQSEIFSERMTIRRLQKELKLVKDSLQVSEGSFTQLYEELVATRLKDQELEGAQNGLENKARMAALALQEERKALAERSETVRQLQARIHDLETMEGDVVRKKAIAERKNIVLQREVEQHSQDVKRVEKKYQEGVEVTMTLEQRCREEEAKLKEETLKVEQFAKQLAEEKRWTTLLKQDLAKAHAEIEAIQDQKNALFKESKSLDKKGIMEGKRAREAESEAKKVRELLVDSSSSLVSTTHELTDEKQRVTELQKQLEHTQGTLKEYQELAATRKNILEGVEKEVQEQKQQLKEAEAREYSLVRDLKKTKVLLTQSMAREKESDAETVRVASSLDMSQREFRKVQGEVGGLANSIEELQLQLEDSKELVRIYRQRSNDLDQDLRKANERITETQEREYQLKVESKSMTQKLAKEQDVNADLLEKVELMNTQLQETQLKYAAIKSQEEDLLEQISRLKEKVQDATERGDILERGLHHSETQREVFKDQATNLKEEVHERQTKLRSAKKEIQMTVTDLESLRESHEHMAEDLSKTKKQHSEIALKAELLESELLEVKDKLKIKVRQVAKLETVVDELNNKLGDALFEITEERQKSKTWVDQIAEKDAKLKKIEHEAYFSKESVFRVCDDIKEFQEQQEKLKLEGKGLEGEIETWQQKFEESQVEVARLKDINWRIAQDLETSKLNLRDVEAMVKKTTTELKSGKGRMVDAEARNIELSSNVSKLMEALIQAEAREKEALEMLADGKGLPQEKKKKKVIRTKTSASMNSAS